ELKKLTERGYSRVYTGGVKMLELPETAYSQIEDLELQARLFCRGCCEGRLTVVGASCPSCSEEFDFEGLIADGWDPDMPKSVVKCTGCGETVRPTCVYSCSHCDEPVPARLI